MPEIYLRPLRMDDAKISYKWRNDPRIWAFTGSRPTREVSLEMEEAWMQKVLSDEDSRRYAICLRENDVYVGNVYLVNINWRLKSGEEGIFIGDVNVWGCGIGTRARLELQSIVARDYGIKEIVSRIRVGNIGSLKSAIRAGFIEIGRNRDWIMLHKLLDCFCAPVSVDKTKIVGS